MLRKGPLEDELFSVMGVLSAAMIVGPVSGSLLV